MSEGRACASRMRTRSTSDGVASRSIQIPTASFCQVGDIASGAGTPMLSRWKHASSGFLRALMAATAAVLPVPETPVTTRIEGGFIVTRLYQLLAAQRDRGAADAADRGDRRRGSARAAR